MLLKLSLIEVFMKRKINSLTSDGSIFIPDSTDSQEKIENLPAKCCFFNSSFWADK